MEIRVRFPLLTIITDRTAPIDTLHARASPTGMPSLCVASGNTTILGRRWRHRQCLCQWRARLPLIVATFQLLVTSRSYSRYTMGKYHSTNANAT